MGRRKRRAAIVRAQGRRKAKAECRHIGWSMTWKDGELFAEHCRDCGARLSLGPSNDDIPDKDMRAALGADSGLDAYDWDGDTVAFTGGDGWPWDPTRPVAGQYEQWLESGSRKDRVALWDAIHAYVRSCGGDPSKHVYGNTARMEAVWRVENAVDKREAVRRG